MKSTHLILFQVLYIIPGDDYTGCWISLVVGGTMWASICFLNPFLAKYAVIKNVFLGYLSKQLYNFVATWMLLFYWRGGWSLLDYAGGWGVENWQNNVYLMIMSVVLGWIFRSSFGMIGGAPLYVSLDFKNIYTTTPGLYRYTVRTIADCMPACEPPFPSPPPNWCPSANCVQSNLSVRHILKR